MKNKPRVLKRILFWFSIFGVIAIIWLLAVSESTAPIEQITEDGWFEGKNTQIREIRLYVESLTEEGVEWKQDFTVWITDEEGKTIWQKNYYDVITNHGEMVLLEQYERGYGIDLGSGRYQIHNSLTEKDTIRVRHKILMYEGSYKKLYFMCGFAALLFLAVILAVTYFGTGVRRTCCCFFLSLLLLGVLYSLVMPPLSVPDEESHFLNAYDLSSKMLFQYQEDGYGNRIMRKTDAESITYLQNASSIGRWYDSMFEPANADEKAVYAGRTSVSATTPGYAYLIPAMGISLARLLRMNGHWVLLMGRLFNLLGAAAIMAFSIYLIPFGKKFFCVLCLLPEVVYLCASYSYDAINLALCFLAVAYFFYMIDAGKQVKIKNMVLFLAIMLLMIPIKLVYAPLLGLLLLIPPKQLQIKRRVLIGAVILGIIGLVGFLVLRGEDIIVLLKGLDYNTEEETRVSLKYMLQNPVKTISVFIYNMMYNLDYYLKSIMGEFVGRDRFEVDLDLAYLPEWIMVALGILLSLGIYTDEKDGLKRWKKAWLAVIGAACCFLFLLSMYLANNTVQMNAIHGVQGRYFLPVLLLLPAIFSGEPCAARQREQKGMSLNSYIMLAAGIDMIAIFVQLQHITMDYYG